MRAVILAAGASSRMGRAKAALQIASAGDTFLARIIRTSLRAGLPQIVVVAGAHLDEVRRAWPFADQRVHVVANEHWQRGQLSSLLVGLDLSARVPVEAIAVTLVDVPLVTVDTMQRLMRAWRETRAPIVRPARGSEHGHPVIFDRALFAELRHADPTVGAKSVVRAHAHEILNLPIDDPGAYLDVDTPDDYARMKR